MDYWTENYSEEENNLPIDTLAETHTHTHTHADTKSSKSLT